MSSLVSDRLLAAQTTGAATSPMPPRRRLTADERAAAAAEPPQAAAGWPALLAECAGLALGHGERQAGAARLRQIVEMCIAAGVDQTEVEAWIEVGRQRASTALGLAHKTCVLWDS